MNPFGEPGFEAQDERWAEFLDRLVHDLREPLRSISAFSELLTEAAGNRLGGDGEEALAEILSGTKRIRTLIDGLSGLSLALRETSDSPPLNGASLQLAFDIVLDSLDGQIRESGATVAGEGLPRVNVKLERLIQLIENLIGNSLKFRGEAAPVIRVYAAPEGEGWKINVEDNGLGVDPADCEAIFKPFVKIHGRKYPGSGLGLAVCRQIVETHGGQIRMAPHVPSGAVCSLWLPKAQ